LLFHEEEKEEEVVGVVVGMEYLVSLADVGMQVFLVFSGLGVGGDGILFVPSGCGMQVFLCFQDDEEVGMQVFQDEEEVQMERLVDVGIKEEDEEEGNHLRKEPVPYSVNYKESIP
jgi:hypothetical protein